jgi:hypothetical protein
MLGHGSDADGMAVAFVGCQPVVAPPSGFGRGGDERLVPELTERDRLAAG